MVGDKLLSYSASRAFGQSHFSWCIGSDLGSLIAALPSEAIRQVVERA
jgi:hypothetical protein